jgi:hypothetical protein
MDYFASDQASHTSKGPGWWLASDGVWYAPELRPSAGGSAGTMSPGLAGTDIAQQWPQTDTAGASPTGFSVGGANQHHRSRRRGPLLAVAAVVVVGLLVGGVIGFATGGAGSGWSDPALHVVGPPITAGGMVIALNVSPTRHLELTAVDPADGSLAWSRALSASAITPGVAFGPTAIGSTVLGLAPARNPQDPNVTLQGSTPPRARSSGPSRKR